jgi:hypothetical protein
MCPGVATFVDVGKNVENGVGLLVGTTALIAQAAKGLSYIDERGHFEAELLNRGSILDTPLNRRARGKGRHE